MLKRNGLIGALRDDRIDWFRQHLQPVAFKVRQNLYLPNRPFRHVYFPTSGVISLVNEPEPGQIVEFATIGREGMVGLAILLDAETMPSRAFVQVPGQGFRLSIKLFKQAIEDFPEFHSLLMRYTLAVLTQVSQIAACNRIHEVQERCARWLLQTHDRVDGNQFYLTQEFLAQMLGVHRPTVTVAAKILQADRLIEYSRGEITISDRKGLEAAACSCYQIIRREYAKLLPRGFGPKLKRARKD